jgi:hypothetical protein
MAIESKCEDMSGEFSVLVVEVVHINGPLGGINIQH